MTIMTTNPLHLQCTTCCFCENRLGKVCFFRKKAVSLQKKWKDMKKRFINSRSFRQLLSILGFGSAAFVFSACYGPVPREYQDGAYADSVSENLSSKARITNEPCYEKKRSGN